MLVYLDTAQYAWLEQADPQRRGEFLAEWRAHGCQLGLSIQTLQETAKPGASALVEARLSTILSLGPLRGVPASAAGLMVREVTVQIAALLDRPVADPIDYGRTTLFPLMDPEEPERTIRTHIEALSRFNALGEVAAMLEGNAKLLKPLRPKDRVDPREFAAHVERMKRMYQETFSEDTTTVFQAVADEVVRDVRAEGGDVWTARLKKWGLADLKGLDEIRPEDYSKAAGFLEAGRFAVEDIAQELDVSEAEVLAQINELRPYDAPGYSIEMAIHRARHRHDAQPSSSDQVDEEHVSFAPYVDLMFVDKRTLDYLDRERRREDGRLMVPATESVRRARDLEDVLRQIRLTAREESGEAK